MTLMNADKGYMLVACLACAACVGRTSTAAEPNEAIRPRVGQGDIATAGDSRPENLESQAAAAIRESAAAFVAAYNAHELEALVAGFASEAEFITEEGESIVGRDAIGRYFAEAFAQSPEAQIALDVETARVIASGAAIEEGVVEVWPSPGKSAVVSRYMALHVQRDGRWLIAWSRDFPASAAAVSAAGPLESLDWLVGDWVGETEGAYTRVNCRWLDNRRYLLQEFTIRLSGRSTISCTSRIGWDPQARKIVSWTFDSNGGFSEARWVPAGDRWLVKSQGVTHRGRVSSATSVVRRIDADTIAWKSRDRADGPLLPSDSATVVLKRRAPPPEN